MVPALQSSSSLMSTATAFPVRVTKLGKSCQTSVVQVRALQIASSPRPRVLTTASVALMAASTHRAHHTRQLSVGRPLADQEVSHHNSRPPRVPARWLLERRHTTQLKQRAPSLATPTPPTRTSDELMSIIIQFNRNTYEVLTLKGAYNTT